jgi:tetrahydromethanopterin:alpha-L-glutamate ligase
MNRPVTSTDISQATPTGPRIVLFVEDGSGDWHARRLKRAMEARGASGVTTTLAACAFDTACPSGLDIPGFAGLLPDGAFVRSVSTGTLEQITFRLGILHALRESGVRVWNEARSIERCVDKSTATFLFQRAGLPTPPTRVVETLARAQKHLGADPGPAVVKPLFGSQGNGVTRVRELDELPVPDAVGDVYYMQHYLRAPGATQFEDWRVLVSCGRILSSMTRRGKSWITNVHQGAEPLAHDPCAEMSALALAAVEAIGADYAGVDLIRDASGRLMVLEINSNPAWKGLQSVTKADIADALASDFLAAVARARA